MGAGHADVNRRLTALFGRTARDDAAQAALFAAGEAVQRLAELAGDSEPVGPPADAAAVRSRLRGLVEADGHTQSEIAGAAGMSQPQLSQILTGHRADPSITTVGRILAALGRSWADLD
jgi:DNA-binding phage protein